MTILIGINACTYTYIHKCDLNKDLFFKFLLFFLLEVSLLSIDVKIQEACVSMSWDSAMVVDPLLVLFLNNEISLINGLQITQIK